MSEGVNFTNKTPHMQPKTLKEACELVLTNPKNLANISPKAEFLSTEENYNKLMKVVGKALLNYYCSNDIFDNDTDKNRFMAETSEIIYDFQDKYKALNDISTEQINI